MSKKIRQMGLADAILNELKHQHPTLNINEEQLDKIVDFVNQICDLFNEKNLCDSCNDWPRGGCLSTCSVYGKESNHE